MWTNLGALVDKAREIGGKALDDVKKISQEIELQLDAAVAEVDGGVSVSSSHWDEELLGPRPAGLDEPQRDPSSDVGDKDRVDACNAAEVDEFVSSSATSVSEESEIPKPEPQPKAVEKPQPKAVEKPQSTSKDSSQEIASLEKRFEEEKMAMGLDFEAKLEGERKKHQKAISKLEEKNAKLEAEANSVRDKMKESSVSSSALFETEKKALMKDQEEVLARITAENQEAIASRDRKYKADRKKHEASLKATHDAEVEALREEFKKSEENLSKNLMAQRESYEKQIQVMNESLLAATRSKTPIDALKEDGLDSDARLSDLETTIERLKSESFEKDTTVRSLEFKVADLISEIEKISEKLREKDKAYDRASEETKNQLSELETALEQANMNATEYRAAAIAAAEEKATRVKVYELKISELTEEITKMSENTEANDSLIKKENQISELEETVHKLTSDVTKLTELVKDRERALGTATENMSSTLHENEELSQKVQDLHAEILEKDNSLKTLQSSASGEVDLRKQIAKLQEVLKEKDDVSRAIEHEGQVLAKKQSEMEKSVRKSKAEVKEKETEIQKLKESKEQLTRAIEEMQEALRKHEGDVRDSSKSLTAMQAVSQASAEKLRILESEVLTKTEELNSQRKALETSWGESSDLKRTVAELRAEIDDLRRKLGEGTNKAMETESGRRDIEQREAVLRATNKQLQESMQRSMQESSQREERLRDEINEMRKRWQDAVTGRETLASELASSTAPLLRQISSLQDTLRSKSDSWQAIEATLQEKAMKSSTQAEVAESKRQVLEEVNVELKMKLNATTSRAEDMHQQITSMESEILLHRQNERSLMERMSEVDSRLALEIGQKQSLSTSLRELEARLRCEIQETKDTADMNIRQAEIRYSQLKAENDDLQKMLSEEKMRDKREKVIVQESDSSGDLGKSRAAVTISELLPSTNHKFIL
jgi:chromosome segregation ATPase